MRSPADAEKIRLFLHQLGRRTRGRGRVYLTGGASALLEGWRESTIDVDLKIDPEPGGVFEAIAQLKIELDVNVELAAPDDFLPPLPGWREHSRFIARHGALECFHYDFRAQALAKLARAHDRDLQDVRAMLERGLVTKAELAVAMEAIEGALLRYPALDAATFQRSVRRFLEDEDA